MAMEGIYSSLAMERFGYFWKIDDLFGSKLFMAWKIFVAFFVELVGLL